jgi:hypothetical protein
MSCEENTIWLEGAYEMLDGAIEQGNYALAKDIIADTFDKGFAEEARQMNLLLRNAPVRNFLIKSPIQDL